MVIASQELFAHMGSRDSSLPPSKPKEEKTSKREATRVHPKVSLLFAWHNHQLKSPELTELLTRAAGEPFPLAHTSRPKAEGTPKCPVKVCQSFAALPADDC